MVPCGFSRVVIETNREVIIDKVSILEQKDKNAWNGQQLHNILEVI
jgi:hypothetical protein